MNAAATEPLLNLDFLSHGTLLMADMALTRRFYEEFLGLEVVQTSQISFAIRLNGDTSVACVAQARKVRQPGREYLRHYNIGLAMAAPEDVVVAHRLALEHAVAYEIRSVGAIAESDGRVGFPIGDRDGNYWEILYDATRPAGTAPERGAKPVLDTRAMAHCACECVDLAESRKLFEGVLGLEVVRDGPDWLELRLNSATTIRVVETGERRRVDKHGSHMGFDVATEAEVDAARDKLLAVADDYGITKVVRPRHAHGNYSFYFVDRDENHWEILDNPKGGYRWRFEQGGDLERPFLPNKSDAEHWRELVDPETNEMRPTR